MGYFSVANSFYSTASGYCTTASADYSTASGQYTTASADYSTASGFCTTASGYHSTASGFCTTASGYFSTASGKCTTASGYYSIASGCSTTASGYFYASVHNGLCNHIGNATCSAYANFGVVLNGNANNTTGGTWGGTKWLVAPQLVDSGCHSFIGNGFQNSASGRYSIVLNGKCNTASEFNSTASGYCTIASGLYSTASGYGSTASSRYSSVHNGYFNHIGNATCSAYANFGVVLNGNANNTTGGTWSGTYWSVAPTPADSGCHSFIGNGFQNNASGVYSSVFNGYQATASGQYSTASGKCVTASGYISTASGVYTSASGYMSTASGLGTTASDYYSTASGNGTTASGFFSTASGNSTIASANYSTASGRNTTASGNYSTASGYCTTASGVFSFALGGYNTTASGRYSTASGNGTTASACYSTASGRCTTASECYTLAQGLLSCASQVGQRSWANASFSGSATDQQQVQYNLSNTTTSAVPSFLWLTGNSLGGGQISIKPNSMMLLNILTSGIETTGTNIATSQDYVVISNVGGTTSIIHQSNIKQYFTAGGLGITIIADNTNDVLRIQVVGTATTMRWMAYVYATEILYAT